MSSDRDRLIRRLNDWGIVEAESLAKYLIANGVILPPCKVGTRVWLLKKDRVPDDDYRMNFHDEWVICETNFQLSMID